MLRTAVCVCEWTSLTDCVMLELNQGYVTFKDCKLLGFFFNFKSATISVSITSKPRSGLKELIAEVRQQVHAQEQGANSKEDTPPHHPETDQPQITARKD